MTWHPIRNGSRGRGFPAAVSIGSHPEAYVEKPPIPSLPPKASWRHDGDSRITAWCHGCLCRVIFNDAGECVWCDEIVRRMAA